MESNYNPSTRLVFFCDCCMARRQHGEVLLNYPVRNEGMRYAKDWACLVCHMTLQNGLLPCEASTTFLLVAAEEEARRINLPFGNK